MELKYRHIVKSLSARPQESVINGLGMFTKCIGSFIGCSYVITANLKSSRTAPVLPTLRYAIPKLFGLVLKVIAY
jgi:hypothetical protein